MRVIVLGGGVIGISTAYYLAEAGHEVVVIDRQEGPALETSFANAGQVSPGYSSPWAAPGIPIKALKWLFMRHRPLFIWPTPTPDKVRFGLMMLRNCTSARYELNKSRMVPIAEYSRDLLRELRAKAGIAYDERALGLLQLFRQQKQLDGTGKDIAILKRFGVAYELLDADGCVRAEPALGLVQEKFVGGLRLLGDETGDCFKFTNALAAVSRQLGVEFRSGTPVHAILTQAGRVTGIATPAGKVTGDAYVVALGSYSPLLLRRIGIDLPVYPVKGYSITVPIADPTGAPEATVMDETHKVAITRLGNRIRVGGMAELDGYNTKLRRSRRSTLEHVVTDLYPKGGDLAKASFWCGLRPMTPDGPPVIGKAKYANLWLNTGHGTLGWTMSCGSGRVLVDLISGRKPAIDTSEGGGRGQGQRLWPWRRSPSAGAHRGRHVGARLHRGGAGLTRGGCGAADPAPGGRVRGRRAALVRPA